MRTLALIVLLAGGCAAAPAAVPAAAPAAAPAAPPATTLAADPVPAATSLAASKVTIDWERGISGLGFFDYFGPAVRQYDDANGESAVVIYRVYGHKVAGTGLQPPYRVLGDDVWYFDFYAPKDGKSRRGQPGSGRPLLSRELPAAERYQPDFVLDRQTVKVDSTTAAGLVRGNPDGDMTLVSATEYRLRTGKPASGPVWRIDVLPSGETDVDAVSGKVL